MCSFAVFNCTIDNSQGKEFLPLVGSLRSAGAAGAGQCPASEQCRLSLLSPVLAANLRLTVLAVLNHALSPPAAFPLLTRTIPVAQGVCLQK